MKIVTPTYVSWKPADSHAVSACPPKAKYVPSIVQCLMMMAGRTTNEPRKLTITIGIRKPCESMIICWLTLWLKHLTNKDTRIPATRPIAKHAPIFSIQPAPVPQIMAPETLPMEISLKLGFPSLVQMEPIQVPITLAIIENQILNAPAFILKDAAVPVNSMMSVYTVAKVQNNTPEPISWQTVEILSTLQRSLLDQLLLRLQANIPKMAPKRQTTVVPQSSKQTNSLGSTIQLRRIFRYRLGYQKMLKNI